VALVGLPGAGKTVVAPLLAARLGWRWDDLDAIVERAAERSVPELLREEGEARFRARELEALRTALSGRREGLVLACGGGVVVGEEARGLIAAGATVAWLRVDPATALDRLGGAGVASRPLLAGDGTDDVAGARGAALERLRALEAARKPLYAAIATVSIDTSDRSPEDVASAVEAALRERWAGSES
jgi:shikimate kinase